MQYLKIEITVPGQLTGSATLTAYLLNQIQVAKDKKRPAVIVCPGGGYKNRSERENEPVIMQFLAMGCQGFLLDYSVAPNRFPISLLELAKAVEMIRRMSDDWNIDSDQVYICGFSAAGHLACSLGVFWNRRFVYDSLNVSADMVKPNGLFLCYPVISSGRYAHNGSFLQLLGEDVDEIQKQKVSLELHVTKDMPEAFIWHTYEDGAVPVENSMLLAMAMRKAGVNFELHIYPKGGHGLALANEETSGNLKDLIIPECQSWVGLAEAWLKEKVQSGEKMNDNCCYC